jgi:hypothetical protein
MKKVLLKQICGHTIVDNKRGRKYEREEAKKRKAMWPSGVCMIPPELSQTIKDGEKFTISGIQRKKDGTYNMACKPGEETVFTAKQEKTIP